MVAQRCARLSFRRTLRRWGVLVVTHAVVVAVVVVVVAVVVRVAVVV